jgi:hypothetical protein
LKENKYIQWISFFNTQPKRLTDKTSHHSHTKENRIYWASTTGKAQLAKCTVC